MSLDIEFIKKDLINIIAELEDKRILGIIYCFVIGVTEEQLTEK